MTNTDRITYWKNWIRRQDDRVIYPGQLSPKDIKELRRARYDVSGGRVPVDFFTAWGNSGHCGVLGLE